MNKVVLCVVGPLVTEGNRGGLMTRVGLVVGGHVIVSVE